jgi:endonuclease/exonuclease/phosphatase family metal-dependent hydrolase
MRFAILIPLLLALMGCAGSIEPQAATNTLANTIRLASWNLEHLAEQNGTGCRPRSDADYAELRRHAERLQADVVAFQEVENEQAAARVFPADQWIILISERHGSGRTEPCREAPNLSIRRQAVGFAVRRGIPFRRNPDVRELGLGDPDLRWGVDVTLRLPRPIRLLAVHLKSGCNSNRDLRDRDCGVLFNQAPVIEAWIDARARASEHFAILGDLNRRTSLGGDAFLASISDDDPPGGRIVMTDEGRGARCVRRFRDFIDHIALGIEAAPRLVPDSFVEYTYDGDEARHPSDHCPIRIDVATR